MKKCFQQQIALTPALSHGMGEGESHSVSLEFVSAGFAKMLPGKPSAFACYSLSRRTGEGQGEGREVRQ